MPRNPTHCYGTNAETLLLLAWSSALDLHTLARQDRRERNWKYPTRQSQDERHPAFPADVLKARIAEASACLLDDLYGFVLLRLVDYRLLFVDVEQVADTLSLNELADPWHALFYADAPYHTGTVERRLAKGPANETVAFWQAASQHVPIQALLLHLSESWQDSVCRGADALQTFFLAYPRQVRTYQQAPFFVRELLCMSLKRVNWHTIAANVLQVEPPSCTCKQEEEEDDCLVRIALFDELLGAFRKELREAGDRLPEPQRTTALFLHDLCRQASGSTESAQ